MTSMMKLHQMMKQNIYENIKYENAKYDQSKIHLK